MTEFSVPSFPLGPTLELSRNAKVKRFFARSLGIRIRSLMGLGTFIPEMNCWFIPHDAPESGLRDWSPYRADVFRILFANYTSKPVAYFDIDVAFLEDPFLLTNQQPFVYRWTSRFSNNAIMYFGDSSTMRQGLLKILQKDRLAIPGHVLRTEITSMLGIHVEDCNNFDPMWDQSFKQYSDSEDFFDSRKGASIASHILENCRYVHWHGSWNADLQPVSAYSILLDRFTERLVQ